MVNAPDWTFLTVRPTGGPVLRPGTADMLSHRQELDLRHGILTRTNRYRDASGRTSRVTSGQVLSLAHRHLAFLETMVEAEGWSGDVVIVSAVNGTVANRKSAADSHRAAGPLVAVGGYGLDAETVLWESRTNQSGISMALAVRTRLRDKSGGQVPGMYRQLLEDGRAGCMVTFAIEPGRRLPAPARESAGRRKPRNFWPHMCLPGKPCGRDSQSHCGLGAGNARR